MYNLIYYDVTFFNNMMIRALVRKALTLWLFESFYSDISWSVKINFFIMKSMRQRANIFSWAAFLLTFKGRDT